MTFTATGTGGRAPYAYKWWVYYGGMWSVLQDWTASSMFVWTPATGNANYRVGVWIRSAGRTADLYDRVESTTSVAFAINLPPPLTLTTLGADKTAPQNPGTTMTFTATASGGSEAHTSERQSP